MPANFKQRNDWKIKSAGLATNGAEKGQTVNEIRGDSWYATMNSRRRVSIGEGRNASAGDNTLEF